MYLMFTTYVYNMLVSERARAGFPQSQTAFSFESKTYRAIIFWLVYRKCYGYKRKKYGNFWEVSIF